MSNSVAVIGGGPAGMLAAAVAAKRGKAVTLFEKNPVLGKKLLITGKGRCNVTNAAEVEELIKQVPVNGRFLYSAFYTFTNDDLITLLNKLGVPTKVERGGRVFPVSDKAADVRDAFRKLMATYRVRCCRGEAVSITDCGEKKRIVFADGKRAEFDAIIIATGGKSYPRTGSTGDGYRFAEQLGHTVTPLKPSLVPLELSDDVNALMGLSLRNVAVWVEADGKRVYEDFGEMLFTHYGVSGPVILSASSHMRDPRNKAYTLHIDLKPALDIEALDKRILRDFEQEKNKDFINALDALLPKKMIPYAVERSGISPRSKVNAITREERRMFACLLKDMTFSVKGMRPIDEAIITSGGVNVKEINPSTMESKLVPGIFFAGEVLDVDAYTGGYNLQIAFSTGFLAGKNV
ncbi:MAG: NAD(P)/FAD-dependent oxidoreductase [Ruminococcaceae bacterium]|nr:NAD(P)/FAD-dependent oxidoreductase [Oscillospiraceae bacterium]